MCSDLNLNLDLLKRVKPCLFCSEIFGQTCEPLQVEWGTEKHDLVGFYDHFPPLKNIPEKEQTHKALSFLSSVGFICDETLKVVVFPACFGKLPDPRNVSKICTKLCF